MNDIQPQVGEHPRLDWLLENWRLWMRSGGLEELHCQAAGFWASGSSDFDSMVEHADLSIAMATGAAIDDLVIIERTAIYHRHLDAVWRSNRMSMDEAYASARINVSAGLKRRDVP